MSADCRQPGGGSPPHRRGKGTATAPPRVVEAAGAGGGVTLAAYAAAKRLPEAFLRHLGLQEVSYFKCPALLIPYFAVDGSKGSTRYRFQLEKQTEGDGRFNWKKGSRAVPYGLWRLDRAREANYIVLVNGESDAQTLWHHDVPALGLPGVSTWKDEWAAFLEGIARVYVIVGHDSGGNDLRRVLAASPLGERVYFVELSETGDVSDLHVRDPNQFRALFDAAVARGVSATADEQAKAQARAEAAWERCAEIARDSNILDRFVEDMTKLGAVGEERAARLLFLVMVSRLLPRPVSAVVKGPSSAGKSFTTECVLRFFPASAFYELSGMSERFLVYDTESLAHRMLVISEASALEEGLGVYLVRTLLSEGRLIYGTVEKAEDGEMRGRRVEKPGPTGVILTTTSIRLHPENETRLFSIPVDDTSDQTARVMISLASGDRGEINLDRWHALAEWPEAGEQSVVIPFAKELARKIPPVAVRLRRDFGAVLNLVKSHALLHRASRETVAEGIVATFEDYTAVRALVADLVGEAAQASVSKTMRETVAAVQAIQSDGRESVSVTELARELELDKSAASRRYHAARSAGYLQNLEAKRGLPARIVLGEPLPAEVEILPPAEALQCCSSLGGEVRLPSPFLQQGPPILRSSSDAGHHPPWDPSGSRCDGAARR